MKPGGDSPAETWVRVEEGGIPGATPGGDSPADTWVRVEVGGTRHEAGRRLPGRYLGEGGLWWNPARRSLRRYGKAFATEHTEDTENGGKSWERKRPTATATEITDWVGERREPPPPPFTSLQPFSVPSVTSVTSVASC